jgi:hypothetical protein
MPPIPAKDLTREVPRSPFDELGGMPWLARMIDKVRAEAAGTLGPYTPFPGGINRQFLDVIGIEPDEFRAVVHQAATDQDVVDWLLAHRSPQAEERVAAFRAGLLRPLLPDSEWIGELEDEKRDLAVRFRDKDLSDIDNFVKVLCVEEGHPIPVVTRAVGTPL